MNYRASLLRQMWKNDIATRNQAWTQERTILQNDLTTLQNSVDVKILEGLNQQLTTKTQTISQQLTQINTQQTKLTQQTQVLEQLLANHEEQLAHLGRSREDLTNTSQGGNND